VAKWLKALGFGDDGEDERPTLGAEQLRRAMRIRETMRWRGFNLEPYTDEEIVRAADLLGETVSADGETTEASREALAEALRNGLGSATVTRMTAPDAVVPAVEEPAEPPAAPAMENPFEETEPEGQTAPESPAWEAQPAGTAAAEEEETAPVAATVADPEGLGVGRTPLVRLKHVLGIHSWIPHKDDRGPYLYCPGCGTDRRGRAAVREALRGQPRQPIAFPEREARTNASPDVESEQGSRPESRPEAQPGTATGLLKWYVASPWWVKALSIFLVFQVVTVVVSVFGG
jgi:hypothetical protein